MDGEFVGGGDEDVAGAVDGEGFDFHFGVGGEGVELGPGGFIGGALGGDEGAGGVGEEAPDAGGFCADDVEGAVGAEGGVGEIGLAGGGGGGVGLELGDELGGDGGDGGGQVAVGAEVAGGDADDGGGSAEAEIEVAIGAEGEGGVAKEFGGDAGKEEVFTGDELRWAGGGVRGVGDGGEVVADEGGGLFIDDVEPFADDEAVVGAVERGIGGGGAGEFVELHRAEVEAEDGVGVVFAEVAAGGV